MCVRGAESSVLEDMMNQLVIWGAITVAFLVDMIRTQGVVRTERAVRRAETFVSAQNLPVIDGLREIVLARMRARARRAVLGGWLGWFVGLVVAVCAYTLDVPGAVPGAFVWGTGLGYALGSALALGREAEGLSPDAPQVARGRATTWADYTSAWDRRSPVVSAATVVVVCVTAVIVWGLVPVKPRGGVLPLLALLVIGVGALGVLGAVLRWVRSAASRPQRARSNLELAWDDALRSAVLRSMLDVTVVVSMITVLGTLVSAASWLLPLEVRLRGLRLTEITGLSAVAVGIVCWLAILLAWDRGRKVPNPSLLLWEGVDLNEVESQGAARTEPLAGEEGASSSAPFVVPAAVMPRDTVEDGEGSAMRRDLW